MINGKHVALAEESCKVNQEFADMLNKNIEIFQKEDDEVDKGRKKAQMMYLIKSEKKKRKKEENISMKTHFTEVKKRKSRNQRRKERGKMQRSK